MQHFPHPPPPTEISPERRSATEVLSRLRGHGLQAYFAGGCVRDELLGRIPDDYDVVTDGHPDQVVSIFDRRFASQVGAHFGVVVVRIDRVMIEVATFRSDGEYTDNRRPDAVIFGGPLPDAQRRDFTVNALFLDPFGTQGPGGTVIDYVGGYEDLQRRVLRAVGDPAKRLAEDHLRALRAARLAAKLGFTIDPRTAQAIAENSGGLAGISRERIGDEVRRMIAHPSRAAAMAHLHALQLLQPIFAGNISGLNVEGAIAAKSQWVDAVPTWTHTAALDEARADTELTSMLAGPGWPPPQRDVPGVSGEAWAALALDLLPNTETNPSTPFFPDHNISNAEIDNFAHLPTDLAGHAVRIAAQWRTQLCISNEEQAALRQSLMILEQLESRFLISPESEQKRLAAREAFPAACVLLRLRRPALAGRVFARLRELCSRFGGVRPAPLVTGDDLITLGLRPGPGFKLLLDKTYDAQLEGEFVSPVEGLEYARGLCSGVIRNT